MLAGHMEVDPLVTPTPTMSRWRRLTITRRTAMLGAKATRAGQVSASLKAKALSKWSYISDCDSDC